MNRDTWIQRCDQVKTVFKIATDSDLAVFLGLTKSAIHQFRRGETELSPLSRLLILEVLAVPWAPVAINELLPKKQTLQYRRAKQAQAQRLIELMRTSSASKHGALPLSK